MPPMHSYYHYGKEIIFTLVEALIILEMSYSLAVSIVREGNAFFILLDTSLSIIFTFCLLHESQIHDRL